jgi:hypothetical protein
MAAMRQNAKSREKRGRRFPSRGSCRGDIASADGTCRESKIGWTWARKPVRAGNGHRLSVMTTILPSEGRTEPPIGVEDERGVGAAHQVVE